MSGMNEDYVSTLAVYGSGSDAAKSRAEQEGRSGTSQHENNGEPPVSPSESFREWGDAIIICAEPGMGRTTLLAKDMECRAKLGAHTRYEDFAHMQPMEAIETMVELVAWCRGEALSGNDVAVAMDNLPAGDEADAERQVKLCRAMLGAGASVILAILPEGESVAEQFGEANCYWSSNLRSRRPSSDPSARLYDQFVQGVPALLAAISHVANATSSSVMEDPGYQQAYIDMVSSSLRPSLMGEERRLRFALILFGHGTFTEVEDVLGGVEADVWRFLARDAPFFGVNTRQESFSCAGASMVSSVTPLLSMLGDHAAENAELVVKVSRRLASRGNHARAAAISRLCPSDYDRCSLVLEWAAEFVDAGEVQAVKDAIEKAQARGWTDLCGFVEAPFIVDALDSSRYAPCDIARTASAQAPCVDAFRTCRMLLRDATWRRPSSKSDSLRPIEELLSLHGRAIALITDGRLEDAYVLLLDVPARLRGNTVTAAMLEMDFVFCSLLMGITPTSADLKALDQSYELLCRANLSAIAGVHETILSVGTLLAGRGGATPSFEANIHRAERRGDIIIQATYLIAAALVDVRARALLRAHVRLGQAMSLLNTAGATYLVKVTHLLDICVRLQLSERVTRTEIASCRGTGRPLDKVVTIILAATSSKRSRRPVGSGRWDAYACPRDVHWILCVLVNDFGSLSHQVREVLPKTWSLSLQRSTCEVDGLFEKVGMLASQRKDETIAPKEALAKSGDGTASTEERRVHINMLGGLEVLADGVPISGNVLERRRAKSMLALLACLPGHAAKRFTIMESVWPEHDYETALRCVYSATSVLRAEICGLLKGVSGTDVVASNKSERTVLLKMDMVSCDVDAFEEKARSVLDGMENERLMVTLCREVEDLYKGDLFVPPTDGAGVMESRARELRELFADAMVAGAQAAVRTEQPIVACRFARKAHETDPMREDAVRVLLVALCGAGRQVEAEQVYEQYVSHVVDVTRRPPSRSLRKVVGSLLLGRGNEGTTRRSGAAEREHGVQLHHDEGPEQLSFDLGMDEVATG